MKYFYVILVLTSFLISAAAQSHSHHHGSEVLSKPMKGGVVKSIGKYIIEVVLIFLMPQKN